MSADIITFIGGGNMARSLIGGLIDSGVPAASIRAADPSADQQRALSEQFGIATFGDNPAAVADAATVIFAVKPQTFRAAAESVAQALAQTQALVISIAAGIPLSAIGRWLGGTLPLVRVMPNTPALIGAGASGAFANAEVDATQRARAQLILAAVGEVCWVEDEGLIDAVTAVSGSGPAYFFRVIELVAAAGVELGLPEATARQLALQTAYGAARMARESDEAPATLRKRVTSPGGTTAAALEVFERSGIERIFLDALTAARDRSRTLAKEFGDAE